jgi:hypothetical protein
MRGFSAAMISSGSNITTSWREFLITDWLRFDERRLLEETRCILRRRFVARPELAHRLSAFIQAQARRDNGGR